MTKKNFIKNMQNRLQKIYEFLENKDFVNAELEFDNLEYKMIDLKYMIRKEERENDF